VYGYEHWYLMFPLALGVTHRVRAPPPGESTTSHHHHRPHSLLVVPSTDRLVFLVKETEERDQWVEDIRACAQACHHQS
jgi:hypothetical protein